MKLYNLYKEVILESVDIKTVQDAIKKNLAVNISYEDNSIDSNGNPRYCQILAMGKTSKDNIAIRVYQIGGPNLKKDKNGKTQRWKTFRIDRITNWSPTKFVFYAPPDELYNALGDKTLNIPDNSGVANMAIFREKDLDSYREKYSNWQSNLDSKKTNEPMTRNRVVYNPTSKDYEEEPKPINPTTKDYEYSDIDKNLNNKNNKPQPNYPTAKDYQYSNLYSDKVADEEGNEEGINNLRNGRK